MTRDMLVNLKRRPAVAVLLTLAGFVLLVWQPPVIAAQRLGQEQQLEQQEQAGSDEELPALLEVPSPDLSGMEEAVAAQLQEMRDLLFSRLEGSELSFEQLASTYGDLGRLYHAYELIDAAEACYLNAKLLTPIDFKWPHNLGHLYMTAGRLEESSANFEYALSLRPASVPTLVWLGQVYLGMNRLEEAEARLRQALELEPDSAPAMAALGEIALSRQEFQKAVEYLTAALELAPAANRLHYPLAMAYRGLGDMDSARAHLEQRGTVGLRPNDPLIDELSGAMEGEMIHLLRGKMAFAAERYTDAAEEFRKAAEAQPDSARAKVNLGSALGMLGDVAGAIEQYRAALSVAPENTNALFNLGYLLARRGDYEQAAENLRAVVRIEPRDSAAHFELAEVLRRSGMLDEALTQYSLAVALTPLDESARLGEAEIAVQKGRYEEATELLDNALAMLPSSPLIAHALARLLAACPNLNLRDGVRALDLAQRVFEADPRVVHAETVAMALAEVGRCQEAAEWQLTAVESAEAAGEVEWALDLRAAMSHYERGAPCRYPANPSWKR